MALKRIKFTNRITQKLRKTMKWMLGNRKWVFSGIGVAIVSGIISWFFSDLQTTALQPPKLIQQQSAGDSSQAIQAGRDVYVNYDVSKIEKKVINEELLKNLLPDHDGGKSIRALENELGLPVQEYLDERTYKKDGYRISISNFVYEKSYATLIIGPMEDVLLKNLPVFNLSGAWGNFNRGFGELNVGHIIDSYDGCKLSEGGPGFYGNARCMAIFEIQCSRWKSNLYLRAGVDSCYFSTELWDQAHFIFGFTEEIAEYKFLQKPEVRDTKINYIAVSNIEKKCPRAAGGCD